MKLNYSIYVNITAAAPVVPVHYTIGVNVTPSATPAQTVVVEYPFAVKTIGLNINFSQPILKKAYQFLNNIITDYIDEDRELKTLLNYGNDKQTLILSYRYGPKNLDNTSTLQLKLLQPIPDGAELGDNVFISREVSETLIDSIRVRYAPPLDTTPYLRPRNTSVKVHDELGKSLNNVTMKILSLDTGSVGGYDTSKNISFEDSVFRQWYSFDFNSSELNIDFTDYNNFVFYGSAAMRLAAFQQKLKQIESLTSQSKQFEGSVFTGSLASAGATFIMNESARISKEKESIIRSFDRYEQYLYFTPSGSTSTYSASAYYADDAYEYNPIGYWPKDSNGKVYSPYSLQAEDWYVTQSAIAQRFDEFNENNLVSTIPTHIREDGASDSYITFVAMMGHFFDTIKPYVDQFPYVYSRGINPNDELSKDLVAEIAESVGFKLPTLNSIYSLSDNILGTETKDPRRNYTAETHKRLLHTLPFFAKAKGTRTALATLLKTFGITEQVINVKESGTAESGSMYVFNEFTTGLDLDSIPNTGVTLPVKLSNRTPLPQSIQFNLTVAESRPMTILNGDNKWALNVQPHPTNSALGRFELVSGSTQTLILSSSYEHIFGDELLNVTIRTYDTGSYANLFVTQVDAEDVIFSSSMSETYGSSKFVPLWSSSNAIYLGGSGSLVVGNYNGTIDEIRLWGTVLSDEVVMNTAFDPGSNAGDAYTDASDYLYVQLSFNKIDTGSFPTYLLNESPYKYKDGSPSLTILETYGSFSLVAFSRYNRTVRQLLPQVGNDGYVTRKVKIAPPPVFTPESLTGQGVKKLSRTSSIVKPNKKRVQIGRNKVSITTSPTEIINQNIIRNLGLENINAVLGSPTDLYSRFDSTLDSLKSYYSKYYYVDVNINQYIRILSELNSILSQVVEYFIPSKATVLQGVVIEPNILEQVKVPPIKNLRFYGANTRKTNNAASSLTDGTVPDYEATFNLAQTIPAVTHSFDGLYETFDTILPYVQDYLYADGLYNVYETQHEDWHNAALISHSLKPSRAVSIMPLTAVPSEYDTYDLQHLDWAEFKHVSSSYVSGTVDYVSRSFMPHRKQAIYVPTPITGSYDTVDSAVLLESIETGTYDTYLASIDGDPITSSDYDTYDLQHLDWNEFKHVSSSYVSGTVDYVSQSFMPHKKQRIDVGLANMNKIKYNDVNKGSDGAEPYNRIYPRKLFDYEINSYVAGGDSSIYPHALYEIKPSVDFDELGTHTYFNSPSGLYYYPTIYYTPSYAKPLNQTWNFDTQQFISGVPTWSYGQRFNINDVVYQYVTSDSPNANILGSMTGSARAGNKRYYVFKSRPDYVQPADGTSFYSGSVPTYIPPSLDNVNWQVLKFTPIQIRESKRVVFDTFRIPDSSLNNYITTTISADKLIDIPARYIDIVNVSTINKYSYTQGEIALQNIAALFAVQANASGIRIRLYRTPSARDADLNRAVNVFPSDGSGVLIDTTIDELNTVSLVNPSTMIVADNIPPLGKVYYTVNNTTGGDLPDVTILFYYFALEIEPRVPIGYLRKHYKFFRDNSTATKRRNYLGCKNTVDTTFDGLPPVQIFVGEGTELVVSNTQTNTEIQTGGGGTLNVT